MKKVSEFALLAIVLTLLIGLYLFRDYNRYSLETIGTSDAYVLDTRTGKVWLCSPGLPLLGVEKGLYYMGKPVDSLSK